MGASPAGAADITGDLLVTGPDVRSNETINITGSVIVAASGSIDWTDVVLEFNGTGQPGYGLHIDGGASLVRVTVRAAAGAEPYVFLVNSSASLLVEASDISGTAGAGVDPGPSGTAGGTDFSPLRGGIQLFTSQARIGNSTVHDGEGALITVVGASPRIVGNHIHSARYLEFLVTSSFSSGTQTSAWRAVAACVVVAGGSPDLDTNRVDRCGLDGSANATDLGTMGAWNAVSNLYLVSAGVAASGGSPSFRLHSSTDIGRIASPSSSFTLPGPVNVTHTYARIVSWGIVLKNTGDVTVSGGWSNNADVAFEAYLDAGYTGAAPTLDIGPFTVNATFLEGMRFTVANVGVGADIVLNQVTVTGGAGTAVSARFVGVPSPHSFTVASSTIGPAPAGGRGIYIEDSGSSASPDITLHHNTITQVLGPMTLRLGGLSAGAGVSIHNNSVSVTSGLYNTSCCSGDRFERGAIDVQAVSFTGGTLDVRVEDNRVYNQTWTLASTMYPGVTIYHQNSVSTAASLAVVRNDISNVSDGIRIYENYGGSTPMNSVYTLVGNRVSISDGNGLTVYANSFLGQLDPIFHSNIFDRPGADRAPGYGALWQVISAAVTPRDFGNITVYGNATRTIRALHFQYIPTNPPWTFNMDRALITNTNIGIYLLRTTVSIYNSDLTGATTAIQCQECTARLVDSDVYPLSATVSTNGEVTAFQRFGAPRVQWQGDGGLPIPSGNLYLQWRGPFSLQTLMTVPFVGARVDNTSVPMWKRTVTLQDEYANLTPVFRLGGVDLPGIQVPFTSPYWGDVTIIDPELPDLSYTTPAPNAQIRARTVTVKGHVGDRTTGVAGVEVSIDGSSFTNVTSLDTQAGTWETQVTFPSDGGYNLTIHAWDRARWAVTAGNFSTGFKEVVIGGIVIDTVAPSIVFTQPPGDITQNSSLVEISGQVVEANTLSVFRVTFNGFPLNQPPRVGGLFSFNITNLTEGPNQVSVIATDAAGNTNVASRTITRDTIAPHLVVVSPVNGSSTNRAVVSVMGEVEAGVELRVNGALATLPHPVTLNAGQNVITVVATDLGRNVAVVTRVITLDTLAPTVTFLDPPRFPYDTGLSRVVLVARASEPLKSVTLNNITYPLSTPTTFTVEIYLDDGTHILVLSVTDLANNTAEVSPAPVIRVDTLSPGLVIDRPADGAVQSNRVIVICGRTDTNAQLHVTSPPNRFQLQLSNPLTGEFCYEETRTADGAFPFTFEASDAVGNTATLSITVVVDTQAPEVEVIGLGTNHETRDAYVQLRGRVSPGVELTVNGTPVAVVCNPSDPSGFCDFDMLVPVGVGQSTLTLLARDGAGNVQAKTFNILREAEAVQAPVDLGTPLLAAGLAAGLALFALFWVRTNAAAAEAHPGIGGEKAARKQRKRKERRRPQGAAPEVIYEVDAQAMYRDDFHARPPARPPR